MKSTLLLASAFFAITSAAFAMEADAEMKTRTITIVADLDARNSERLKQPTKNYYRNGAYCDTQGCRHIRGCISRYDLSTSGEFTTPNRDYTYDHNNHTISFSIKTKDSNPIKKEFTTSYCEDRNGDFNRESFYDHTFSYEVPAGVEDITVQATLLSIKSNVPANINGYFNRNRNTITFDK